MPDGQPAISMEMAGSTRVTLSKRFRTGGLRRDLDKPPLPFLNQAPPRWVP